MDGGAGRRLGTGTYVGYAVGSVGTGIFSAVPGLLLLTFMVRQLGVPPALAGVVIFLPRLWDVVTDPFVGGLSDRTRSPIGARRPWLLAGALTLPVAFWLLFAVPDVTGAAAAAYVLGAYVLATTAFTVFQVPYVALPAEMTDDYDERTTIMAWRIAFLTLGILVAGAAAPEIVAAAGGGRDGYARMGLIVGAVLLAALLGCFAGTRRVPVVAPVPSVLPVRAQLRAAAANAPFRRLLACFFLQAVAIAGMLAGVEFFAAYILGDPRQTTALFACLVGPALVTMPVWNRVGHRLGKRAGYTACTVIFALGALSLVVASPDRLWLVYAQVLAMGTAYAGTQLFPFAMLPDTISADTAATGLRRAGAFTGVWTAGEKAGFALGPALFAGVLAATGFVETQGGAIVAQPGAALTGLRAGFTVVPAALLLLSLLPLRRYTLDAAALRALAVPAPRPTDARPTDARPTDPTGSSS